MIFRYGVGKSISKDNSLVPVLDGIALKQGDECQKTIFAGYGYRLFDIPESLLFSHENFANQLSYYHIRLLTVVSQYIKE